MRVEAATGGASGKMFKVILFPDAQAVYDAADPPLARKLARCFAQLERNPLRHSNIKPLKGPWAKYFRYRVGDHRVVFSVDRAATRVDVLVIAHRRDVYD